MPKVKYLMTLALVALCVTLASGMAFAQDEWNAAAADLPTDLDPGDTYDASVTAENTGTTTWDTNYELWSMEGSTAAPVLTHRWGLDLVPVTTGTGPGGTEDFAFTVTAPPWLTLEYAVGATPTSVPTASTFECGWMMSDGGSVFGPDKATSDVTILAPDLGDVGTGYWAFAEILECQNAASAASDFIVQGYGDGNYHGDWAVTRGQLAVFVARAAGYTDDPPAEATFDDVPDTYWSFGEIEQCATNGVVQGYPDGFYRPGVTITRDQMAVYMIRAAGIATVAPAATFPDVPTDHWAAAEIEACVGANITQGYADGFYRPDREVDRGQMAVFVWRALVGDVLLGGPDATDVALSVWDAGADNLLLPGEADYYGYSSTDVAPGAVLYVALDANRVADGTISFEVSHVDDGGTPDDDTDDSVVVDDSLDVTVSSAAAQGAVSTTGCAYLVAYYDIPATLVAEDYTVTLDLINGASYSWDFTVE